MTLRYHFQIAHLAPPWTWLMLLLFTLYTGCGSENPDKTAVSQPVSDSTADINPLIEPAAAAKDLVSLLTFMVPDDYEFAHSEIGPIVAEGDLNGDSLPDVAFLLQNLSEEMPKSLIKVAYQTQSGKYEPGESSGNFGPEPATYLDPEFFQISNQILQINYQSMRWGIELKFRREKKYGDLRLIGSESFSYGNAVGDGAGGTSTNYLTGQSVAQYQQVDMETGVERQLPARIEKVSTQLIPLQGFNDDTVYELQ